MHDYVARNRVGWDDYSAEYQRLHSAQLEEAGMAWGVWSIPEAELGILGDVARKRILELGCGAAQWTVALERAGADPFGLDLSAAQLAHAPEGLRLVQAGGHAVPFAAATFDIVFCDHGAMSWADPADTLPEVARVLRTGGLLAFNATAPLLYLCYDEKAERPDDHLREEYFTLGPYSEDTGETAWVLPYGEYIRLFRDNGFVVEDLIELRPPEGATTTYEEYVTLEWARRWPAEQIWRARKA